MKNLKFVAPTEVAVHLSLTSGHTALVTAEGTVLEPRFHREAIARGCMPEGVADAPAQPAPATRRDLIKNGLKEMLNGSEADDFTPNGQPNKGKLDARLGFVTERTELEDIYNEIIKEAEDETADDDEGDGEGGKDSGDGGSDGAGEEKKQDPAPAPWGDTRKSMMAWLKKNKVKHETDANAAALLKLCQEAAAKKAGK